MISKRTYTAMLAAAMTLGLVGCGQTAAPAPASGTAVEVQEVATGTISTENRVSGKILADKESTIMVASSAKCTAVHAQAGDTVSAGDVLCTLDLSGTLASYNAATISYNSALQSYRDQSAVFEAQIALYQKNVDDLNALFAIGAASQAEIDGAALQLQSAMATRNSTLAQLKAGAENARSALDQLSTALENVDNNGNVVAPISGTLVTMNAVENGFTSPALPVAVIDSAEAMKVTVSVSEALVTKLAIGDSADVTVSAAGKTFSAVIRAVDQAASQQTKLYNVTLDVPDGVSGLLSGMFADVTFYTDVSKDTLVIPTEALLTSGETQFVYTTDGETATYVEVQTGLTGSGTTEIVSGLTAGDQLVTVGQAYLHDGDSVRIVTGEE